MPRAAHAIVAVLLGCAATHPAEPARNDTDFDGDGEPDLLVLQHWDRALVDLPIDGSPGRVLGHVEPGDEVRHVGDVTGDGIGDIAVSHGDRFDDAIDVLRGTPSGFEPTPWWTARYAADGLVTGDFDGDGIRDLAVHADGGVVRVLGGPSPRELAPLERGDVFVRPLFTLDLDGDGRDELCWQSGDGELQLVLSGTDVSRTVDGRFFGTVLMAIDDPEDPGRDVLVTGSLSGLVELVRYADGGLDVSASGELPPVVPYRRARVAHPSQMGMLAVSLPSDAACRVFSSDGRTTLGELTGTEPSCPFLTVVSDLDGDDLDELATPRASAIGTSGLALFRSTLGGGFAHVTDLFPTAAVPSRVALDGEPVVLGDVDGDGRDDFVVPIGTCSVLVRGAERGAVLGEARCFDVLGDGDRFVRAGDVDGDGADELIAVGASSRIATYDGETWSTLGELGDLSDVVALGDIDADGLDDLALVPRVGAPSLLRGRHGSAPEPFALEGQPVAIGDLDGDGIDDLVVGTGLYLGGPALVPHAMPISVGWTDPRPLGDLDGNGRDEVGTVGPATFVRLELSPEGAWVELDLGPVEPWSSFMRIGDPDGDGDDDAVMVDAVIVGDPVTLTSHSFEDELLAVLDADGDGLSDVLAFTSQPGRRHRELVLAYGDSDLSFAARTTAERAGRAEDLSFGAVP